MNNTFWNLYAETLELQAQLMAEETRGALSSLPTFLKAKDFLDVGCGIGSQASVLKDFLKSKNYLGIDISPEFIKSAKQRFQNEAYSFVVADILNFKPEKPFDFVLSFAVFQHLPNIGDALRSYAALIKQGGALAIMDANTKDEFQSAPDLPELRMLYRAISEEQTRGKRKTNCLDEIKRLANQFQFRVVSETQGNCEINNSSHGGAYVDYINHVVKLVTLKYSPNFNQEKLTAELVAWRNDPKSSVKFIGGSWLILEKQ